MKKTLGGASAIAMISTLCGAAAAQSASKPAAAPPTGAAPAAVAPPPAAAPSPTPAAAPTAPAYPPPPGYAAAPPPSYPAQPAPPGPPLAPSPLYGPPPGYGSPSYYGPPPPAYPPPPPPPRRPEGTAGFVGRPMIGLAWDVGIPVASVHDFTSNVSAAGFDISLRYWLHPRITLGLEVEWQTYRDEKPRTTYALDHGALTATAYNSLQAGSLRFDADYYFLDRGPILPFAGVNIGYGWSTFQTAAADIALYDDQDSVVLGAEVGALFALAPRKPLVLLAARYSAAPSMEFLSSVKDVQSITIQLGLLLY